MLSFTGNKLANIKLGKKLYRKWHGNDNKKTKKTLIILFFFIIITILYSINLIKYEKIDKKKGILKVLSYINYRGYDIYGR